MRPRRHKAARVFRGYRSESPWHRRRALGVLRLVHRSFAPASLVAIVMARTGLSHRSAVPVAAVLEAALSGNVDQDGLSRIKQRTIAKRLGVSVSTVERVMRVLYRHRLLTKHQHRRERDDDTGEWYSTGPNGYELPRDVIAELRIIENANRAEPAMDNPALNPTQPSKYRPFKDEGSSLREVGGQPAHGPGPTRRGHVFRDDGYGTCTCGLLRANGIHVEA